ncbi:hypothetical protein D3C84_1112790 [compost metagenome]
MEQKLLQLLLAFAVRINECNERRACAAQSCAQSAMLRGLRQNRLHAWNQRSAIGLMQPILHRLADQLQLAGRQCGDEQRAAAYVVNRIRHADFLRQRMARFLRR